MLSLYLHSGLIRFHFKKRVPDRNRIPGLFEPTHEKAAVLRHAQRRHDHIMRH